MTSSEPKQIYLNPAQYELWALRPNSKAIIGSRRLGKSRMVAMDMLTFVHSMPRCLIVMGAQSYKYALTRTVPSAKEGLAGFGYYQNVHYFVGCKAPKSAGFAMPYIEPDEWSHCIHFYNGTVFSIISDDVKKDSNSATFDGGIFDEAGTLNREKMMSETIPAISGSRVFYNVPWSRGVHYYTDALLTRGSFWIFEEEKNMDVNLIRYLKKLLKELNELMEIPNKSYYYEQQIKKKFAELNHYRKFAYLYREYDIFYNIHVVGEDYVKQQKRNLKPHIFKASLLTKRQVQVTAGFYSGLTNKHYYNNSNKSYLDNNFRDSIDQFNFTKTDTLNCLSDNDINPLLPLYIAADSNVNINWIVVGQPDYEQNKLRIIKSFYVKHPYMLQHVCRLFAEYYKPRVNRDVIFYYDHTFLQGRTATFDLTFHEVIESELAKFKFNVTPIYIGQAPSHSTKYQLINQGLRNEIKDGKRYLLPLFNATNNEDLIIGIENTNSRINDDGFGKDKSKEKLPDSIDNPVQWRTDSGDAFDTLYIGCNLFPDAVGSFISNSY